MRSMRLATLALPLTLCVSLIACGDKDAEDDDDGTGGSDDSGEPDDTDTGEDEDTGEDPVPTDEDGDGWSVEDGDCDDADSRVYPEADERCNEIDDDCDGEVDEDAELTWYVDDDGDGYGDASTTAGCDGGDGLVDTRGDCDDADPDTYPDAPDADRCDGVRQDCDGDEFEVPGDHATIQDAVDAAGRGDRVCVGPGTWGHVDLDGKAVHVIGVGGPAVTTLDGQGASRVLTFFGDETRDTVVEGFTLANGDSDYGGAADLFDASPTLRNLIVRDNVGQFGGGISSRGGDPLIEDVIFQDNVGTSRAGGLHVDGGTVELSNVWLKDNEAGYGGGAYIRASDATLDNVRVEGNVGNLGGGLYLVGTGSVVLDNVVLVDNSGGEGGGVHLNVMETTFTNVSFVGNVGTLGGAIYAFAGTHTFGDTIVAFNESDAGAGVHVDSGGSTSLSFATSDFYGHETALGENFSSPVGTDGNVDTDPAFLGGASGDGAWDLRSAALGDAGDAAGVDPDGTRAGMGAFGGAGAGGFDLDQDGSPAWWGATSYGSAEAAAGWDCDDRDPELNAGSGC
jgi:hypothetical protein